MARRARVLAVFSAALTAAGMLGNFHWCFEIVSHFVAWHALLSAAVVAAFLIARRRNWAAATLLLCIVQAFQPLAWYGPPPARSIDAKASCRLLLANVLSRNRDTQAFLTLVKETDPDVICVQEVSDHWARALESLVAEYPVHAVFPRPDNFGIALYSRLEGPLPEESFQKEHGVPALATRFRVNGREVALLNVHALPPLGRDLSDRRNAQLRSAQQWFRQQNGPAILLGDLNLTMFSPVYHRVVRESSLQNARAGLGPMGTWPVWVPWLRLPLDQCLLRGDVEVAACRLGPDIGSDHLPLIVDVCIPAR